MCACALQVLEDAKSKVKTMLTDDMQGPFALAAQFDSFVYILQVCARARVCWWRGCM
jgi:hypothetical protein